MGSRQMVLGSVGGVLVVECGVQLVGPSDGPGSASGSAGRTRWAALDLVGQVSGSDGDGSNWIEVRSTSDSATRSRE